MTLPYQPIQGMPRAVTPQRPHTPSLSLYTLCRREDRVENARKENALLRRVLQGLLVESRVDWAASARLRDLMMALEEEPGVPIPRGRGAS